MSKLSQSGSVTTSEKPRIVTSIPLREQETAEYLAAIEHKRVKVAGVAIENHSSFCLDFVCTHLYKGKWENPPPDFIPVAHAGIMIGCNRAYRMSGCHGIVVYQGLSDDIGAGFEVLCAFAAPVAGSTKTWCSLGSVGSFSERCLSPDAKQLLCSHFMKQLCEQDGNTELLFARQSVLNHSKGVFQSQVTANWRSCRKTGQIIFTLDSPNTPKTVRPPSLTLNRTCSATAVASATLPYSAQTPSSDASVFWASERLDSTAVCLKANSADFHRREVVFSLPSNSNELTISVKHIWNNKKQKRKTNYDALDINIVRQSECAVQIRRKGKRMNFLMDNAAADELCSWWLSKVKPECLIVPTVQDPQYIANPVFVHENGSAAQYHEPYPILPMQRHPRSNNEIEEITVTPDTLVEDEPTLTEEQQRMLDKVREAWQAGFMDDEHYAAVCNRCTVADSEGSAGSHQSKLHSPTASPTDTLTQSSSFDTQDEVEEAFIVSTLPEKVKRLTYCWDTKEWKQTHILVAIDEKPFDEGNLREVYRAYAYSLPAGSRSCVAKRNKPGTEGIYTGEEDAVNVFFVDIRMQSCCSALAEAFNANDPPKRVQFLTTCAIVRDAAETPSTITSSTPAAELHKICNKMMQKEHVVKRSVSGQLNLPDSLDGLMAIEPFISGKYIKYNNNYGFVSVEERNTPQAFSHFTYEYTKGKIMVVDVQGVGDVYTDPQIHTSLDAPAFGVGNCGEKGFDKFFSTHVCNSICKYLELPNRGQKDGDFNKGTVVLMRRGEPDSGSSWKNQYTATTFCSGRLMPVPGTASMEDLAFLGLSQDQFNTLAAKFTEHADDVFSIERTELFSLLDDLEWKISYSSLCDILKRLDNEEEGTIDFKDFLFWWTGLDTAQFVVPATPTSKVKPTGAKPEHTTNEKTGNENEGDSPGEDNLNAEPLEPTPSTAQKHALKFVIPTSGLDDSTQPSP